MLRRFPARSAPVTGSRGSRWPSVPTAADHDRPSFRSDDVTVRQPAASDDAPSSSSVKLHAARWPTKPAEVQHQPLSSTFQKPADIAPPTSPAFPRQSRLRPDPPHGTAQQGQSELATSFAKIFPLGLQDVSSPAADATGAALLSAKRRDVLKVAVGHLIGAKRWGWAAEGLDFLHYVYAEAEPSADARSQNRHFLRGLYAPLTDAQYTKSYGGWTTALQLHVDAATDAQTLTVRQGVVDAPNQPSRALFQLLAAYDVPDLLRESFIGDEGISLSSDAVAKLQALTRSPMLRAIVTAAAFLPPGGVNIAANPSALSVGAVHVMHLLASALLLTALPRELVTLQPSERQSAKLVERSRDVAALAHRVRLRKDSFRSTAGESVDDLRQSVTVLDLEALLVPAEAADNGGLFALADALHRACGVDRQVQDIAAFGPTHQLQRDGIAAFKITRRSYGPEKDRVLRVLAPRAAADDKTDSREKSANGIFVLPMGTCADRRITAADSAFATLCYAAVVAIKRFLLRARAGDSAAADVVRCCAAFRHLEAVLLSIGGVLFNAGVYAPALAQVSSALHDLAATAPAVGVASASLQGEAAFGVLRVACDVDPQDVGVRRAITGLQFRGPLATALGDALRTPAPRVRWQHALAAWGCFAGAAGATPRDIGANLVLGLAATRKFQLVPRSAWDTALRVAGRALESIASGGGVSAARAHDAQTTTAVRDALIRLGAQGRTGSWESVLRTLDLIAAWTVEASTAEADAASTSGCVSGASDSGSLPLSTTTTSSIDAVAALFNTVARVTPPRHLPAALSKLRACQMPVSEDAAVLFAGNAIKVGDAAVGLAIIDDYLNSTRPAGIVPSLQPASVAKLGLNLQYIGDWRAALGFASSLASRRLTPVASAISVAGVVGAFERETRFTLAALIVATHDGSRRPPREPAEVQAAAERLFSLCSHWAALTPPAMQRMLLYALVRAAAVAGLVPADVFDSDSPETVFTRVVGAVESKAAIDPDSVDDSSNFAALDVPAYFTAALRRLADELPLRGWAPGPVAGFNHTLAGHAAIGELPRRFEFKASRVQSGWSAIGVR
jgi:hypothetical protein